MKKIILFIWFLSALQLKSQQFFDSGVYYLTVGLSGEPSYPYYGHAYYHMVPDSVSRDTQYYTMWNSKRPGTDTSNTYVRPMGKFKVTDKRVFITARGPEQGDFLLYDFNLQEGDSTRVNGFGASIIRKNALLKVDSIRNIQLGPLTYRAQYVKVEGIPFTFVEHIGSIENGVLFFMYFEFESVNEMVNLCKNDTLLYWKKHDVIKSGWNTCSPLFYSSGISDRLMPSKPFVFPNPSGGMVQIDAELAHGNLVLEIYGMNGQLLQSFSVENGETIDLKMLPSGLYYLRLLSSDGNSRQILSIN